VAGVEGEGLCHTVLYNKVLQVDFAYPHVRSAQRAVALGGLLFRNTSISSSNNVSKMCDCGNVVCCRDSAQWQNLTLIGRVICSSVLCLPTQTAAANHSHDQLYSCRQRRGLNCRDHNKGPMVDICGHSLRR
jgi:hypothetical protein